MRIPRVSPRAQSAPSTSNGQPRQRFSRGQPCPVCGGCEDDPRGSSKRCFGYTSGQWIYCTREDHSAGCKFYATSQTYSHRLTGKCPCGTEHNPAPAKKEIDHVYKYRDASRNVVFETVRFRNPKTFRQRRSMGNGKYEWNLNGVETVLYQLPFLLDADEDQPVWIVEGEKDVDKLGSLAQVATCNPMGAGKWRDHYSETLRGRHVLIIPDNDQVGREHAQQVAQSLYGKAASVKIVDLPNLPERGDVSDFLTRGGTVDELTALAHKAIEWTPSANGDGHQLPVIQPIVSVRGLWTSCLHNSLLWLEKEGYGKTVRYDRFRQAILVDGRPLDDETVIAINAKLEAGTLTGWCLEHVRSALTHIAHRNAFSSLSAWLDSLKWDGTERLLRFFPEAYGTEWTPYSGECSKILFISGVARAFQPGCQADVMVVLIGPQGLGKSMGIASLCPEPAWFADDLGCDLHDRKAGEGLRGKWMVEFSEFSRINRSTLDVVKSFVSRRSDYYRPAYGRIHKDFPRTCVFVGTTNDPHPLHDRENRRFMPIHCVQANKDWIAANRDQLWAEAVARYRRDEPWWVTVPTLLAEVAAKQEEARQDDCWESILEEKIGLLHTITMKDAAEALDIGIDRLDRSTQTRIGFALSSLGYERKRTRIDGKLGYVWSK
jgi:5S rRNA maturation endonuclease (ribonuclease M5)